MSWFLAGNVLILAAVAALVWLLADELGRAS